MKKLLIAAACVTLVSCNKSEPPPAPVDTTSAADAVPAAGAPTGDMAGTYEVTMADGTVVMETINADGTYVDTTNGTESERGKWRADGDKTCFDADGDKPEACFATTPPGPDGSFKMIGADGKETGATVRKIAAGAVPAAAPAPAQ